ncbi:MAG: 1-(5-phosphoribosyl)-5-[(5-phosphoribosylamino)methylideneamino] imidazole-4-carboxamide isomerase [Microscillaceae bacterium]|jgi:phosphoribosylformimino-5-aminoimidazole carboxamide ribotide isomerase|nr:1-(5-phosphoribosyl)-5-[(5-phosphoribosylamino)methylideneamino] imidazole-4-carboxamide isomerase [Microscillaceae bacterium]
MIQIIPSMAISEGKVVKTVSGHVEELKVYEKNPLDLAMEFEDNGLKHLHLIDIDGANRRKVTNYNILDTIRKYTKLEIDFTGGVTSDGDVRTVFEFGAKTLTVATVAIQDPEKFKSWLVSYGNSRIILAADSLNGVVRTGGWQRTSGVDLYEHLNYYQERGIRFVKATEIGRDGTLAGPNFELYKDLINRYPDLKFFACGGIRSTADIEELDKLGVHGIIFGKAFYEGLVKLADFKKFL